MPAYEQIEQTKLGNEELQDDPAVELVLRFRGYIVSDLPESQLTQAEVVGGVFPVAVAPTASDRQNLTNKTTSSNFKPCHKIARAREL